jgi:hypothetical protein
MKLFLNYANETSIDNIDIQYGVCVFTFEITQVTVSNTVEK